MHDAEVSAWARALAARRRVVGPIRCPECGREVVATTAGRWKKTYCSPACQWRSYRRRNPDRIAAWQRAYRTRKRLRAQEQAAPAPRARPGADAPDPLPRRPA